MNKENQPINHFAWCALVALSLARRDGIIASSAQENLYLTRWLAQAEKQKRFSRIVASDISWLLREGRTLGARADLPGKLEYLWRDTKGDLHSVSDLFRLQHALHGLQLGGWDFGVISDAEWAEQQQPGRLSAASALFLNVGALEASFDKSGKQYAPLPVHLTGSMAALNLLLKRAGWRCEKTDSGVLPTYHLLAT